MPKPASATSPQQGAVAVATREPVGFTPYAPTGYPPHRLPYPPLTGTPLRRRSGRLPKLLITLGVLLAVLFVSAVVIDVQDRNVSQNALDHTTIQFPDEVAGLNKITGPEADRLTALAAVGSLGYQTVGYKLADGTPRGVVVIGKMRVGVKVDAALAAEEKGFHDALAAATTVEFTDADAGPLGGRMQCGSAVISGVGEGVCMFVDRAVVGSVVMFDRHDGDASQDQTLVLQMRAAIETRT
jgi:hypothetical protein